MWARFAPSRRLALLFVGALGAALSFALASESARVPQRTPLVPRAARGEPLAIPLEGREGRHGNRLFRLGLSLVDRGAILGHDELWLFLSSATPHRRLIGAELRQRGTPCALVATGGDDLSEDQPTVFVRTPGCAHARALPGPLDLTVEVKGDGELSLLGFVPDPGAEPGKLQVPPSVVRPRALDVRGHLVWYPVTAPRIVLLNQMWRLSAGSGRLLALVCAGVALALGGCLAFPTAGSFEPGSTRRTAGLRAGVGAALLAGSLALLYAAVAPPLSGPDEPYHLLGFADLTHDASLARDTVAWMGETHLWRIRQQPEERFRTIDVGHPFVEDDPDLRATEVAMRSAVLARLWGGLGPQLAGRQAPGTLMALRLVNAFVFALAVGAATAFAVATVSEPFPQWLSYSFLFVPSLPFFAMHVSETALLCSSYALLATGVGVLFQDGPRAHWAGIPLGLGTGLMLAGGRSPWPLCGLVAAVLLGRVLLGSRVSDCRRAAVVFWSAFSAGAALLFLMQDDAYRRMTVAWAERYTAGIPTSLRDGGEWLLAHPAALIVLAALAGVAELVMRRPRMWVAARLAEPGPRLVRAAALALAGVVLLSLAGSLLVSYPQLELEPRHPLPAPERVTAVLATMTTMFRLGEPNFPLSTSFWVGFGWLDTSPKPWFEAGLTALVACALVLLLWHIAQRAEARRLLWLLLLAAGAVIALVFYTLTTQVAKPLHGRYLIGWYLCLLAVIGGALTLDLRSPAAAGAGPPSGTGRAVLLLATAGLIHVYCLCFILARYF